MAGVLNGDGTQEKDGGVANDCRSRFSYNFDKWLSFLYLEVDNYPISQFFFFFFKQKHKNTTISKDCLLARSDSAFDYSKRRTSK